MSNYVATTRSNYFRVKDPEALKELLKHTSCDGEPPKIWQRDGDPTRYAFGCDGTIDGLYVNEDDDPEADDWDLDALYEGLQKLVADDDAIIIKEVGHEKWRHLTGLATIITSKDIKEVDIDRTAKDIASKMLGVNFETEMSY